MISLGALWRRVMIDHPSNKDMVDIVNSWHPNLELVARKLVGMIIFIFIFFNLILNICDTNFYTVQKLMKKLILALHMDMVVCSFLVDSQDS
ncbi:hypothetical protein Scep_003627 [Stephania cephalantha]|uniref:Uncharacterized protein n=1 Tax=Stephania cephalantha TaxID=152367 RepID=A0AAP0KSC1_9MAGN